MQFGRVQEPYVEGLDTIGQMQVRPAAGPNMSANLQPGPRLPEKPYSPALWEVLDGMFGLGIADARDSATARHDAPRRRADLEHKLSLLPPDVQRDVILAIAPEEWAKSASKQYEPQVVAGGSAQVTNGRALFNPKVEMSGDTAVSLTPGGMTQLGQRPPSYAEQAQAAAKDANTKMMELLLLAKLELLKSQSIKARRAPVGRGGSGAGGRSLGNGLVLGLPGGK